MKQPQHLPFLDGIRGLAILAVYWFHSLNVAFGYDHLPWAGYIRDFHDASPLFLLLYPLSYGHCGVAIFFVVSGFCIHLSYQRSRDKSWLNFFNRRIFRIYPPYLFALFLFFFVPPWALLKLDTPIGLAQFGMHALNVHNFVEKTLFGINPSFWSIAVELQLYVIYPLLLLFIGKHGWKRGLTIAFAIELLLRLTITTLNITSGEQLPTIIRVSPFAYWFSWSIGAHLAHCFLNGKPTWLSKCRFDVAAAITLALPLTLFTDAFTFLGFALLTGIAIERLMTNRWQAPANHFFWKHLSLLGLCSYSFYLIHQPIISKLSGSLRSSIFKDFEPVAWQHLLINAGWYPIILLISLAMYHYMEKPSIKLGKAFWKRFFDKPTA